MDRVWVRPLVTLLVPLVLWLGGFVPVGAASFGRYYQRLVPPGLFALGVMPLVSGFALVELVAWIVPRWRPLRRQLGGRMRLYQISLWVGMLCAGLQAWVLSRMFYNEAMSPLVMTITWVGGVAVLAVLAALVSRFGLGNGLVIVLCVAGLMERAPSVEKAATLAWREGHVGMFGPYLLAALAVGLAVRGATWVLPRRLPSSGVAPYAIVGMVMGWATHWVPSLYGRTPGTFAFTAGAVTMLAVAGAWWYERPSSVEDPAWRERVKLTLMIFVAALVFDELILFLVQTAAPTALEILLYVAVGKDLMGVWRAKRHVTVAASVRFDDIDEAVAKLRAAGLSPTLRGANLGVLLRSFGPHAPIEVTVPVLEGARAVDVLTPPAPTISVAPLVSSAGV